MSRRALRGAARCLAVLAVILPAWLMAAAPATAQVVVQGPDDSAELEAFLDGVLAAQLAANNIPGAVVAVVRNGELLVSKGYGYADLDGQVPVDPETTLFRPGSVSKLFTWTAVMQLVEQGQLDLNADVNTYLRDFQIPATFPEPITLAHLMTHTPGFEDQAIGVFVADETQMTSLGDYLRTHIPARVFPPGEVSAYSNYGTALAGYVVEQVTGMPFAGYVQKYIFKPLGMAHSSFEQPLPPELAANAATGYTYADGAYQAHGFEWVQAIPAGGLSATAADMARFMIAHLQQGRYGDARILQTATAADMHAQHFAHDPRASGWTWGFMELHLNGQRLIWHGGTTFYFNSALALLPEHGVGLYVAYNSPGGDRARIELLHAFLDRYYPAGAERVTTGPGEQPAAQRVAGDYVPARSSQTTLEKLLTLLQPVRVSAARDGTLRVTGLYGPGTTRWQGSNGLVYDSLEGDDTLIFRADAQGRVTHLFVANNPTTAYLRLPWYGSTAFQLGLLATCALAFLVNAVTWQRSAKSLPAGWHLAHSLAWSFSALSLAFLAALAGALANPYALGYGLPTGMRLLLGVPWLLLALAVAMVVTVTRAWFGLRAHAPGGVRPWSITLVTGAAMAFVWWLAYWRLLMVPWG